MRRCNTIVVFVAIWKHFEDSATIVHRRSFRCAKTFFSSVFVNASGGGASNRSENGRERKVRPREKVGNFKLFYFSPTVLAKSKKAR